MQATNIMRIYQCSVQRERCVSNNENCKVTTVKCQIYKFRKIYTYWVTQNDCGEVWQICTKIYVATVWVGFRIALTFL
jgi:hypothetical protein